MVEENINGPEEPTGEEKQLPKKKLFMIIGALVLLFILSSAGNYIYLKMTYVPPDPASESESDSTVQQAVSEEEEGPVLTIDLSEGDKGVESIDQSEITAEAIADSIQKKIVADSIAVMDSINGLIRNLQAELRRADSLRALNHQELVQVKKALESQQVQVDSARYRQSLKLAKIVESMPAEDAAKMLESLSDEMVIDILMRLKQRQAAKIMAEFSASRSAKLSEVILKPVVKG